MKTAFVIGRFQPFHNGHKKLIDYALTLADRVTVIIGDTGCARSFRDPWTQEERVRMIRAAYNNDERIKFAGVLDYPYSNVRWSHGVQAVMKALCPSGDSFIVGMQKDDTSFYLDLFPGVEVVKMPVTEAWESEEDIPVSGTAIRRMIFNTESPNYHINMKWVKEVALPKGVQEALQCNAYRAIVEEFRVIEADEQLWMCPGTSMYGWQPKVAVDAMIHTPTRILLIERGGARGRGNFALPDGFKITRVVVTGILTDAAIEASIQKSIQAEKDLEIANKQVQVKQQQALANEKLTQSLTPAYLQYEYIRSLQDCANSSGCTMIIDQSSSSKMLNIGR